MYICIVYSFIFFIFFSQFFVVIFNSNPKFGRGVSTCTQGLKAVLFHLAKFLLEFRIWVENNNKKLRKKNKKNKMCLGKAMGPCRDSRVPDRCTDWTRHVAPLRHIILIGSQPNFGLIELWYWQLCVPVEVGFTLCLRDRPFRKC
jgi:hypothetical protein